MEQIASHRDNHRVFPASACSDAARGRWAEKLRARRTQPENDRATFSCPQYSCPQHNSSDGDNHRVFPASACSDAARGRWAEKLRARRTQPENDRAAFSCPQSSCPNHNSSDGDTHRAFLTPACSDAARGRWAEKLRARRTQPENDRAAFSCPQYSCPQHNSSDGDSHRAFPDPGMLGRGAREVGRKIGGKKNPTGKRPSSLFLSSIFLPKSQQQRQRPRAHSFVG